MRVLRASNKIRFRIQCRTQCRKNKRRTISLRTLSHGILSVLLLPGLAAADILVCATEPFPAPPRATVEEDRCHSTLDIHGAPGQFVSASFTLRSKTAQLDVKIKPTELSTPINTIAADSIDVRYVTVWYQAASARYSIHQDRPDALLVPELLTRDPHLIRIDTASQSNEIALGTGGDSRYVSLGKRDEINKKTKIIPVNDLPIRDARETLPLTLAGGTTQQVWLTFAIPADAAPGSYTGSIGIVTGEGQPRASLPISLRVHAFRLAEPALTYSIYYRGVLDPDGSGSISSELKSTAQMLAELKDMREHGIANPTIYQSVDDPQLLDRVLDLRRQAGIANDTVYWLGIQSGSNEARVAKLRAARKVFDRHGVKNLYVYAVDEAEFDKIQPQAALWRAYNREGAHIFAADYKSGLEKHYAGKVPLLISGIRPNPASNALLKAAGTRVFAYNQPQVGVENPAIYRRNYGIDAWRAGYDGVMNYAYQHAMGSIWNDFDHPKFRDHVFAYPTADGVIPTLAWEGFRAAIDDVRYLTTLRSLAAMTGSTLDSEFLSTLKRSQSGDLDRLREEMAERITALCRDNPSIDTSYCIRGSRPGKPELRRVGRR